MAGGPLMTDFLDVADSLRRGSGRDVTDAPQAFEDVFKARQDLRGIYAKSTLDLDNLEELFGVIEMGSLIGKFPNRNQLEIEQLRRSMITLIFKTIERRMQFRVNNKHISPSEPYAKFVNILNEAKTSIGASDHSWCSVITFNYDIALEQALHHSSVPFDYCLEEGGHDGPLPLLKLHGSINWGVCDTCQTVVPANVRDAEFALHFTTKHVIYRLGSNLPAREHCGLPLSAIPLIVPPTWDKTRYHKQLAPVWRQASRQLEQAENIFVVGYSLPETDNFFRYLFALASEGPTDIRRFWVINPDFEVDKRFRPLIGSGISNRYRFLQREFYDALQDRTLTDAFKDP